MFPYCCLLIICIMLFPCSVFKVHLSLFAQRSSSFERTSFNEQGKLRFIWNQLLADVRGNWWAKVDSNHRPHDYQSCALASWAIGPFLWPSGWSSSLWKLFLESFLCLLSFSKESKWWRLAGSNRWPPACKAGALPAELNPHLDAPSTPSKLNNVNSQALRLQLRCIRQCASHPVLTLGHTRCCSHRSKFICYDFFEGLCSALACLA